LGAPTINSKAKNTRVQRLRIDRILLNAINPSLAARQRLKTGDL
jgi:hypothetical protein